MHSVLGEIDDGTPEPLGDLLGAVDETTISVIRTPDPPSTQRIVRKLLSTALRRIADKLENGYKRDA